MPLADKDFKDIVQADLEFLKENSIPEGRDTEYKQALDLDTSEGKLKFLKQVSAFANSVGGHVIYGVREDKGVPVEVCGLDMSDPDKTILRIENIVRDGLDPRLSSFNVRAIPLKNGKHAVVLRIQKSWNGPHLVPIDGRFYYRRSAGSSPMDATELRNAFLQSAAIAEKVKRYRLERLALIDAGMSPLGSNSNPKVVVHVIPTASLNPGFQINWDFVAKEQIMIFPLGKAGANYGRLNLDGRVVFTENRQTHNCESYLQWFRNGIIETVDAGFMLENKIYGTQFAFNTLKLIENYRQNMGALGVPHPIIVLCSFIGVREFALESQTFRSPQGIDRDDLIIPEVVINEPSSDTRASLRPIFEALWNSAGLHLPDSF